MYQLPKMDCFPLLRTHMAGLFYFQLPSRITTKGRKPIFASMNSSKTIVEWPPRRAHISHLDLQQHKPHSN